MEQSFNWKMKGLAKKVNPQEAAIELQRIQSIYGVITPELIVTEANDIKSVLHPIFEWDDSKAAFNYRLQQARILLNNIQVTIKTDGGSREISVFEVTSLKEGYKSIDSFTTDDVDYIKSSILQQLKYLKNKLSFYKQFDKARELIEQATIVIEEI